MGAGSLLAFGGARCPGGGAWRRGFAAPGWVSKHSSAAFCGPTRFVPWALWVPGLPCRFRRTRGGSPVPGFPGLLSAAWGCGERSRLGPPPPLHEAPGRVRGRGPCVSWAVPGSASGPPVQRVLGASPSFYRRVDALLLLAGLGVVGQHPSVREWVCGRSRLAFPYTCSQRGAVAAATRPLRDTETPGPGERCRASSFKGRQDLRRRGCGGGCFVLLARNLGLGFVARVLLHSLPRCPALPLYIVNKQYRSTRCRLQSDSFCFGSVG